MGEIGTEIGPGLKRVADSLGRVQCLFSPSFQIQLPLGCVFDVYVANPPVRASEFYRENRHRMLGSPIAGLPNQEETCTRP